MTAATSQISTPLQRTHPRRAAIRRCALHATWVVAMVSVILLAATDLFPQRLAKLTQPYLALASATFVVQTLQFHIAVVCLVCAIAACVARRGKLAIIAAMGVAMGFGPALAGALVARPAPRARTTMRLMSMNVAADNADPAALLRRVAGASPDVVILQEYTAGLDDVLRPTLLADYPYQLRRPRDDSDGWAVFSRRPLVAPIDTTLRLHESTRQARFGVRMGDQDVIVYALHLTRPRSMRQIGRNRAEVADLCAMLEGESRPVILAGDFNFTGATANAAALRKLGLRSTHDLAGNGRGSTWRIEKLWDRLPGFRIDHVFISRQLTCTNSQVLEHFGSDHKPIIADIALAEAPESDAAVAALQ